LNYPFIDRDPIPPASAGEAIYHQSNDAFWQLWTSFTRIRRKTKTTYERLTEAVDAELVK
jgi:hypothetical protein